MPRATCRILLLATLLAPAWPAAADLPASIEAAARANGEGRTREATDLYLRVIGQGAAVPEASWAEALRGLFAASSALVSQKHFGQAIDALSALLEATRIRPIGPAFSTQVRRAFDQLSFELLLIKKSELAIRAITALMADDPGQPMRWAILARAHLEQGQLDQATRTVKRGLKLHPTSPELLFVRASISGAISEVAVARANYLKAESMLRHSARDLEQAAAKEPTAPGIHRALGRIRGSLWTYYRATGQYDQAQTMLSAAEEAYSRASQLDPVNPDVPFDLAHLLFTAQDWVWAEDQFQTALGRYRAVADRAALPQHLRQSAAKRADECRDGIFACRQARAVRMARRGHHHRARQLMAKSARDLPGFAQKARQFQALLARSQQLWQRRTADLAAQTDSYQAQRQLGDLWMQVHRFEQAATAYQRAFSLAPGERERAEAQDLLFGTRALQGTSLTLKTNIGGLSVAGELPADMDPGALRTTLEKAHALTMGIFPHRLNGPLHLKVFANQRQFLEQAGIDLGPHQRGLYAFGRLMTFTEPHRSRFAWLEIMVHELSHRYVDEMTYHRAPRWLAEGLSAWVASGWDDRQSQRFRQQVESRGLIPWNHLESLFQESWGDPAALDALYRQSHQVVHWLVRRFGRDRLMTFLAGIRQGNGIDRAAKLAYGMPMDDLERRWIAERRGKPQG